MIETSDILTTALTDVLETMVFLTVIPMDEDVVLPKTTMLGSIHFVGPKSGTVEILVGVEFSNVLAENMGNLDEVDYDISCDAVKELCNVTCGLLLPQISSSPSDVFDLTVPTVTGCDNSSQWSEFTSDENCSVLNVEGYVIATKITM